MREYNESLELQNYAWQFLVDLMNEHEQVVQMEWYVQGLRDIGQTQIAAGLTKQRKLDDSAEVQKAREMGLTNYTIQLCDRLQRELPDKFYFHRCRLCSSILFTPQAQQCFWCGADWQNSDGR